MNFTPISLGKALNHTASFLIPSHEASGGSRGTTAAGALANLIAQIQEQNRNPVQWGIGVSGM